MMKQTEQTDRLMSIYQPADIQHHTSDTVLIDVREASERFQTGQIPGALHMPLHQINILTAATYPHITSDMTLIFYCATNERATRAAQHAHMAGFNRVGYLAGGFTGWKAAGGTVEPVAPDTAYVSLKQIWQAGDRIAPHTLAGHLEHSAVLPDGDDERFLGYGVMGLSFSSGHILGLRRFPANSLGVGYTSVWHRSPDANWYFYQDVLPERGCTRYFGSAVREARVSNIQIIWSESQALTVLVENGEQLHWHVSLASTPRTRLMNAVGRMLPEQLWQQPYALKLMSRMATACLGAGQLTMIGNAPNRQHFMANPRIIWMVADSSATVNGEDVGSIGPLAVQARLGDLWLPQNGIFFVGMAFLESYDANRHLSVNHLDTA